MELQAFQAHIEAVYGTRPGPQPGCPGHRGLVGRELGELAQAVRKGTLDQQHHELGDVLAWLASLANQLGLSFDEAVARYADGCPRCGAIPCGCPT